MIETIDAAMYISMMRSGAALLEQNRQSVNDLNVFPVPDGDTGTNMSMTISTGIAELGKSNPATVGAAADIMSGSLLRGARGNSGVILSLLFRGMAKILKGKDSINTQDFSEAIYEGVAAAYNAVMRPTEGTILTVSRIVAESAKGIWPSESDFEVLLPEIISAGEAALAETTEQNPVLKKAGVIDAGGKGFILIMQGMLAALRGEPVESAPTAESAAAEKAVFSEFTDEDITFTYCTEFIVNRENVISPDVLKDYLNTIGDSIVLVSDDEIIKVHVHTDNPGEVLSRALKYGSLVTVKVENMRLQHTEILSQEEIKNGSEQEIAPPEKRYGFVSVCSGQGIVDIFSSFGVDATVSGGQTMNPSTDSILKAVNSVPAETVFVLPNNKNIIMAAEQCVPMTEKQVIVIPTKTIPQGISALMSFNETLEPEELAEAMTEACSSVKTVSVTYAARDSEFDGMSIKAGEYLAILEGKLIVNSADIGEVMSRIAEAFREEDPDVITLYYGEGVSEEDANSALETISSVLPDAEAMTINGGQPVYYYIISAE